MSLPGTLSHKLNLLLFTTGKKNKQEGKLGFTQHIAEKDRKLKSIINNSKHKENIK